MLYRQRRLGELGEEFEILKLRTMRPDAEADGPQWSAVADDRVTRVGRILRRTHVDEIPQLWNVLRGDMTLVGPRPERPEMVAELERRFPHYTRRHLVKPGIAGWAALRCGYAGSDIGTAWKLCHDLFYIKRRSMLADALILAETGVEVFRDAHRALRAPDERFLLGEEAEWLRRSPARGRARTGSRAAPGRCWSSTTTASASRPASAPAGCSARPAASSSAGEVERAARARVARALRPRLAGVSRRRRPRRAVRARGAGDGGRGRRDGDRARAARRAT